LILNID